MDSTLSEDLLVVPRFNSLAGTYHLSPFNDSNDFEGRNGFNCLSDASSSMNRLGQFELAGGQMPSEFVEKYASPGTYEDKGLETQKVKFNKGTTTLAFKFSGGVIMAVDSRATQGKYISSQTVQKVIPITDRLLGTMAGGAADCLFWERNLGTQVKLHELRNREKCSVAAASKLLANTMQYYKGMGLSMGTMVTGFDETGAQLYYVDDDGTRLRASRKQPYFCVGSGGTYAYGVLDKGYKWDMTVEEAVMLGRKAIYHATFRDAASGGVNNVFVIRDWKWEKLTPVDVYDLHDEHERSKLQAMDTN